MFVLIRAVGIGEFGVDGIAAVELDRERAEKLLWYARNVREVRITCPNVLTFHCSGGFVPCVYLDEETAQNELALELYERLSDEEDYILIENLPAGLEAVDRAYALRVDPDTLYWVGETWETEPLSLKVIAEIAGEEKEK